MSNVIHKEFPQLLYRKFCADKEHDVVKISRLMNVSSSTLYNWIEGISNFPVDLIPLLYIATKDKDFIDIILAPTDLMAVHRQEAMEDKTIIEEALDVASQSGKVVTLVKEALNFGDNNIDKKEKIKIDKAINDAFRELEELKQRIKTVSPIEPFF